MPHDSTTQLQGWIDRMNAGDEAARNELISHAYERLRRLTRKLLSDFSRVRLSEESGDVLNNAYVRLQNAIKAVPVASAADFFRLATRHIRWELLDLARKHRDQLPRGASPPGAGRDGDSNDSTNFPVEQGTTTNDPDKLATWTEFHQKVEQLPDTERAAFDLRYYHGLSQIEAANVLNSQEFSRRHCST